MTDILDLDGWTVLSKTTDPEGHDLLEAEYRPQPEACQKCGSIGHLYKHGTKVVTYTDSPIRGAPAKLQAKVQRYRCRDCGETFLQPLGGIQPDRRMTERCAALVRAWCLRDTFVRIAEQIGCDDKTVRNLAGEFIAELDAQYQAELPVWLGIDETQIDGKMRLVLTDVGKKRPIEMLATRDKDTLTSWLHHFKDRSMVKGVAIDMWRPYRDVVHKMLPGVPVVIDKFHVVRTANYCMERVRIRLQKLKKPAERREWLRSKALLNKRYSTLNDKQRFSVDMWLDNTPELAAAHKLKEAFYAIYDLPREQAIEAYDAFPATVPAIMKADFKVLLTSMKNWRREILAFFDYPVTNAYTEALNGVAKTVNRAGRGYSFEILRARLLFGKKVAKEETWTLATAYPANEVQTKLFMKEQDGRCQCCGIKLGRAKSVIPHIAAVRRDKESRMLLVCTACHERFHTDVLSRHLKLPTR